MRGAGTPPILRQARITVRRLIAGADPVSVPASSRAQSTNVSAVFIGPFALIEILTENVAGRRASMLL